ncbi:non-hydrolyzing UDP-N-acetylglucosamine 2-epimerase, partial [bacterium]
MKQKKKIILIFGTRPEAVKMAPLVLALKKDKAFTTKVILTAQHRHMLDQVMELFKIKSDYDLNIMLQSQSLYHIASRALTGVGEILKKEKPDLILVHGDTSTTLYAGIAGYYEKVPVGHVEAGLRSNDKHNPFPEEINRLLTDALCDLYFAPTKSSKKNLIKENIDKDKIFITGNTVIDALFHTAKTNHESKLLKKIDKNKKLILATVHRRENWGSPLKNICRAFNELAQRSNAQFILPVHPNPLVKDTVHKMLGKNRNIILVKPMDYIDLVSVMKRAYIVLTDSGGIQEEAPALGKPVLVLRKVTERPEAVKAGTAKVIGTNTADITKNVEKLLKDKAFYTKMANAVNPYGDGKACAR